MTTDNANQEMPGETFPFTDFSFFTTYKLYFFTQKYCVTEATRRHEEARGHIQK